MNSWNVLCLFPTKFSKTRLQIFSCQNRKSELSIDGLIISVPFLTFGVRKRQKFFVKWVKKCDLSALLNLDSLSAKLWNILPASKKKLTIFDWNFMKSWRETGLQSTWCSDKFSTFVLCLLEKLQKMFKGQRMVFFFNVLYSFLLGGGGARSEERGFLARGHTFWWDNLRRQISRRHNFRRHIFWWDNLRRQISRRQSFRRHNFQASQFQASQFQASNFQASKFQASQFQASQFQASKFRRHNFRHHNFQASKFRVWKCDCWKCDALNFDAWKCDAWAREHEISGVAEKKNYKCFVPENIFTCIKLI